jgi:hypothetical protein
MKNCPICGSPTTGLRKHCPRCGRFIRERLKAAMERAMIAAFDKTINKFRCFYTNLVLDDTDRKSPLFLTFDHPIPGDNTRLVVCASFVNHLKCSMTETEFRTNIPLLASHFENGLVLDRNNFRIEHFHHQPPKDLIVPEPIPPEPPALRWFSETCKICGKPPLKRCLYCTRCRKATASRTELASKEAALIGSYDKQLDGFRCRYTGIIVDLDEPPGPYHLSYDHRFPGCPGNIVVCLFIINFMKSALSDEEFRIIVIRLAKHFTTGEPFDLGGVKFEYWR